MRVDRPRPGPGPLRDRSGGRWTIVPPPARRCSTVSLELTNHKSAAAEQADGPTDDRGKADSVAGSLWVRHTRSRKGEGSVARGPYRVSRDVDLVSRSTGDGRVIAT